MSLMILVMLPGLLVTIVIVPREVIARLHAPMRTFTPVML